MTIDFGRRAYDNVGSLTVSRNQKQASPAHAVEFTGGSISEVSSPRSNPVSGRIVLKVKVCFLAEFLS